ncbi:MAG: cupin domain-containing protein [Saprospiraceae bacterium]|nr:cupin domain-containing protein [Saprospiraceae bacterium]
MIEKVNLAEKFDTFSEHWTPKLVGALNGQSVKLAKFKGEFIRHHHEHEDELFLVIEGELIIEIDDQLLELHAGEFVIIPKGVSHKPMAKEEVKVLLFEPTSTLNTGNLENEHTIRNLDII